MNAYPLCLGIMAGFFGLVTAHAAAQSAPATPLPGARASLEAQDAAAARLAQALPMLDEKTRRGLALQVALDRAGFSPGEIDGQPGANTERAMAAFSRARGTADPVEAEETPVVTYTITPEDAAGPFLGQIPTDMMEKAQLPALGYASVLELLGERFHASPKLLQRLNPTATFAGGETIVVPNVTPFVADRKPAATPATPGASGDAARTRDATPAAERGSDATRAGGKAGMAKDPEPVTITVTDADKTLEVRNAAGDVIFHAPVTVGSEKDPLPVGEWKVNGVGRHPTFNYNPSLFWDADPSHAKAKIAAGPNNPVGVVWIDLSKEHYGIHGTPEPSRVGHTESHGCIRLTNWDAMRLADLVSPGTKVILQ